MNHIFISHVEEDKELALELVQSLESAGYSTWHYTRDSVSGPSYLLQTRQAIIDSSIVMVIVSQASVTSSQVTKEIVRAHERNKHIIPLLYGITDAEYKRIQPEWEEAIGSATSVEINKGKVQVVSPRIIKGLLGLGVHANVKQQAAENKDPGAGPGSAPPQPAMESPTYTSKKVSTPQITGSKVNKKGKIQKNSLLILGALICLSILSVFIYYLLTIPSIGLQTYGQQDGQRKPNDSSSAASTILPANNDNSKTKVADKSLSSLQIMAKSKPTNSLDQAKTSPEPGISYVSFVTDYTCDLTINQIYYGQIHDNVKFEKNLSIGTYQIVATNPLNPADRYETSFAVSSQDITKEKIINIRLKELVSAHSFSGTTENKSTVKTGNAIDHIRVTYDNIRSHKTVYSNHNHYHVVYVVSNTSDQPIMVKLTLPKGYYIHCDQPGVHGCEGNNEVFIESNVITKSNIVTNSDAKEYKVGGYKTQDFNFDFDLDKLDHTLMKTIRVAADGKGTSSKNHSEVALHDGFGKVNCKAHY